LKIIPTEAIGEQSGFVGQAMRLNRCSTFGQVHAILVDLTAGLGVDNFLYRGRFNIDGTRQQEHVATNFSPSLRRHYDQCACMQIDPAIAHGAASLRPLIWSDEMCTTCGVTFPIQSKQGDVALLSLSFDRSGQDIERYIHEILPCGSLLVTLVHEAMHDIVKSQLPQRPNLTKRETDVLKWVAAGKTSWEISRLLDISAHGVIFHVRNILLKFNVVSRHQAVLKGICLGLL
jgi:LuxR family quorum-sensing transcriptional regulator LasR